MVLSCGEMESPPTLTTTGNQGAASTSRPVGGIRSNGGGGACGGVTHMCVPKVMEIKNGSLASDMVRSFGLLPDMSHVEESDVLITCGSIFGSAITWLIA